MKVIKFFFKLVCVLLLCGMVCYIYAIKVEPYSLTVKSHSLGNEDNTNIRVIQISDVQISKNYTEEDFEKVVERINQLQPDIFVFTGDLYENYSVYGPEEKVIDMLSSIHATYGKYAIWGNRDYGGGCVRRYEDILSEAGVQLLENDGVTIETKDKKSFYIAGLDDYLLGDQDISKISKQLNENQNYRMLMTHEPDTADTYSDLGFNLILSGHSHGGQVYIPFNKGITTSMADKYTRGFYDLETENKTLLYVNQGIGTSRYPIRFGVPPEVTVFDIGI